MYRNVIGLAGCVLALSACATEAFPECESTGPSAAVNTIMPLGASRVEGARPEFESYRYELWKLLVDGGWAFDFIGTRCDEADYPSHAGRAFDRNHEGRGGFTSGEIRAGLGDWLSEAGAPDIVLFSSPGGNDALTGVPFAEVVENINAIIDALQAANPEVRIIIEQLAPGSSDLMTPDLTSIFSRLQQEVPVIADAQSTGTSRVIPVDMFTGFSDALLADDVHYNAAGARFVADRYYAVLREHLK